MNEIKNEETLMPVIRAHLAERLRQEGFHVKDIAAALNITQPAVTQYLKGKRGTISRTINQIDAIINPLSDKLVKKIRSGQKGLEIFELSEAAHQLMLINQQGARTVRDGSEESGTNRAAMKLLKERLQLELKAAEKYLELANKTSDEHTKLLLRLIASDSIRHGDIVSQIISWLELGEKKEFLAPERDVLEQMIALEDSANEISLRKSIATGHPVARLLLEWIDTDEEKHEKIMRKIVSLTA
jgi:uncharacterized protein